jgi:hypothetical protein
MMPLFVLPIVLQKGCTRLATASDKSITKTGRHDIDEILLKGTLNTINQIKSTILYAKRPPTT